MNKKNVAPRWVLHFFDYTTASIFYKYYQNILYMHFKKYPKCIIYIFKMK